MKKLYLLGPEKLGTINKNIYGHMAEHIGGVIKDGIFVGKNSSIPNIGGFRKEIIDKMKKISAPVIRWPGGCFAECYDWRNGIGEKRHTTNSFWTTFDGNYEPHDVGTHEFVFFCEQINAEPYFAANITSSTPQDIMDWVDYCNSPEGTTKMAELRKENGSSQPFNVKYWGIGNENWGEGGNMTPEVYAAAYRKYSVLINRAASGLSLIYGGANVNDYNWTQVGMNALSASFKCVSGYSFHYYIGNGIDPHEFNDDEWYTTIKAARRMEELIKRHWAIICSYGMDKNLQLVIDEWGCWHKPCTGPSNGNNLYEQQSSMLDAMVAAITLNIFNNNCDKIMMANVAQLVNNLHSLFLSCKDKCITTPTYHIFDMYKTHQNGEAIRVITEPTAIRFKDSNNGDDAETDSLSYSASVKDGILTLTVANISTTQDEEIELLAVGFKIKRIREITCLSHDNLCACNTFDNPDNVTPRKIVPEENEKVVIPKASVISIIAEI